MSNKSQNKKNLPRENTSYILNEKKIQSKNFIAKYLKSVVIGFTVLLFLLFGYFIYVKFVIEPKEKEALNEMTLALDFFIKDSLEKSLGGKGVVGFRDIIENFSGTKIAKLASYYLGVIYFEKGQYQNALYNLQKFSSDDEILNAINIGAIGDCYVELGRNKEALSQFTKAMQMTNNPFICLFFAKKKMILSMQVDNHNKMLNYHYFNQLKDKFPEEIEYFPEIDIYIKMLEYKNAKN